MGAPLESETNLISVVAMMVGFFTEKDRAYWTVAFRNSLDFMMRYWPETVHVTSGKSWVIPK